MFRIRVRMVTTNLQFVEGCAKCPKPKKFRSLNSFYLGLCHRKFIILSFSTLHLKGICSLAYKCVFWNVHAVQFQTKPWQKFHWNWPPVDWDSRWRASDVFSLKVSTLRNTPFFLSLHQPHTSHEYYQRIFAMYTMPHNVLQRVNWPSLVVLYPPVWTVAR